MRSPRPTVRCLIPVVVSIAAAASSTAADSSVSRSPFLPPASAQASAAPTQETPLELRGVMADADGSYMFSIYDPTRHSSTWTRLNDTSHEFIVRSYDAEQDAVTVDYQGRSLTLALKTAKVASAPVVMPQPAVQPKAPQPIGGPVVLNPTPADEQRRLEAIAAEVNRRRMIRQQALQASRQAAGQQNPAQNNPQRR